VPTQLQPCRSDSKGFATVVFSLAALAERLRFAARSLRPRVGFVDSQPVYSLHHLGNRNIGDRECVPFTYFQGLATPRMRLVDLSLTDPLVSSLRDEVVVLGGGGLLNPWCWHEVIIPLLERRNKVIGWGIGHHHDDVPEHVYVKVASSDWRTSSARYQHSYPVEKFWICGLRDYGQPGEYVPCSSCMSPLFDRGYPVTHDVVIYQHGTLEPIAVTGWPAISNVGETSFAEVLAFLGSGRHVLTNSYHGVYWSVLLGRKVLLYEPWCSKFQMLKYAVQECDRSDWKEKLGQSSVHPGALAECRALNVRFATKVFGAIDEEIGRRRAGGGL
jgi:hypothetical protein